MRYILKLNEHPSISAAIESIPTQNLSELDLSGENLHIKARQDILQLIRAIPRNYDTLNLSSTKLSRMENQALIALLEAMPAHIKTIILSENDLGRKGGDLIPVFSAIRPTVTTLRLCSNSLTCSSEVFAALPLTIEQLDVTRNELVHVDNAAIFQILSRHSCVQVGHNDLTPAQFAAIATTEFPNLRHLDLRFNDLMRHLDSFIAMLPAFPALTKLRLAGNDLGKCPSQKIVALMHALPGTMDVLDLETNGIWRWGAQGLIDIMSATKPGIHTLILDNNELQSISHLIEAFARVPEHITTLSLRRNNFGQLPEETVIKLLKAVPPHVTCIRLENNWLSLRKSCQQRTIYKERLITEKPNCMLMLDNNQLESDASNIVLTLVTASRTRAHARESKLPYHSRLEQLPTPLITLIIYYLMPIHTNIDNLYHLLLPIESWIPMHDAQGRISDVPGSRLVPIQRPITTQAILRQYIDHPFNMMQAKDVPPAQYGPHFLLSTLSCPKLLIVGAGAVLLLAVFGSAVFGISLNLGLAIASSALVTGYMISKGCFFNNQASAGQHNPHWNQAIELAL